MTTKYRFWFVAILAIVVLVLAACGGEPAAPAPAAPPAEPTTAPAAPAEAEPTATPAEEPAEEPTAVPAEEPAAAEDYMNASREETVIWDIDGGRAVDPEMWNTFVPGARLDQGYHQTILEPLFILNYQTGEFIPWLGLEMTSNETFDVWTLTLREGVTWQDGEAFNADDVVFTIQMMLDNAPELQRSNTKCV